MRVRNRLFGIFLGTVALAALVSVPALSHWQRASTLMKTVADVPLPGGTSRFDYQSFDPRTGRLYLSHMGDGHLVVFDTKTSRVVGDLPGFATVTGVRFVPESKRVYASAAGSHEVVALDTNTLKIIARIPGGQFPDGLAYAPDEQKLFVSDEAGGAETVIVGNIWEMGYASLVLNNRMIAVSVAGGSK